MKTKNTLLLLALLVVAGAAAWFFTQKSSQKSTLNVKDTDFAVADTASVDRIFISDQSGKKNLLEKQPDGSWVLNKTHQARRDMVNLMLLTLHRMQVKRPADKSSRNLAIRDIATMGKKVEIYQHGKLAKVLYVGNTTDNDLGTYFIMEGSENPYVLHIPGFEGFLNTRFDIADENWRSVKVFRSNSETIKSLKIEYLPNPEESFAITRNGNEFAVSGLPEADQEIIKNYLDNYRFVNGEFFYDNPQKKYSDSLALVKPRVIMTVEDANPANSKTLKLYHQPQNLNSLAALDEKNREAMSVQHHVFDRLLVKKEAFRKNAGQTAK